MQFSNKRSATAPAKIILSGEYAVVFGYTGIAIPARFGVTTIYEEDLGRPDLEVIWNDVDPRWQEYLQKIVEYCRKQDDQLFGKLTITSDAPLGKGMGSSTALIIAICRSLLGDGCEDIAKNIEDVLNPGHSGIDFATIWHNSPIEFKKGEEPKIIRLEKDLLEGSELIDTGTPNEATPELVAWMESKQEDVASALETIGQCSERIIKGEDLKTVMKDHHKAQVALGVVPKEVQKLIASIEKDGGAAKVIGAGGRTGGGGMVLVFR